MLQNAVGSNVIANTYWELPQVVDLSNQAEPPFFLPFRAGGGDDWDSAVGITTVGRKFTHVGRVRSTVVMHTERLFSPSRQIAFLYRGQGTVTVNNSDKNSLIKRIDGILIQGIPTTVLIYQTTNGQFTYDVVNAIDFELVAILEVENFASWLSGSIAHPVLQLVWKHLPGYRRLMDMCNLECILPTIDQSERYTRSDFTYRPGMLRKEEEYYLGQENTHNTLLMLPKLISAHRDGKYWINLPAELNDENYRKLGEIFSDALTDDDAVEFLNEAWNGSFRSSTRFMNRRPIGMERAEWYVRESIRAITLFEEGAGKRIKRVAAWQAANAWAFGRDSWNGGRPSIPFVHSNISWYDALSTATYVFSDSLPVTEVQFLNDMAASHQRLSEWRAIANEHGKPLWGYEGGIEIPSRHNDQIRDSEWMGDCLFRYLDGLLPRYFDEFCMYAATGRPWGLIEGAGLPTYRAAAMLKFLATLNVSTPKQILSFLPNFNGIPDA